MNEGLSRRTALRGLGVCMALPWLEAMTGRGSRRPRRTRLLHQPRTPWRAHPRLCAARVHLHAQWRELRGVGANRRRWRARSPPTLAPLAPVRSHMSVITGLTNKRARTNGDGPGDHARSSAAFLTGCQPRKTAGNDIHNGISVSQLAAGFGPPAPACPPSNSAAARAPAHWQL